jgi:predicted nucleic acid-binding Zn ribbon protein
MAQRNEQPLKKALSDLVDTYGLREKLDELSVRSAWDTVAGAAIAKHTVGMRLKRGKLHVRVDSAPLRHELGFMRAGLRALLNTHMGRDVVAEIFLE